MAKKNTSTPKTFEDALQELEQILAEIESGDLGLEESVARYERGTFLIQHCRGVLNTAEKQIELLSKGPDGTLTATPMAAPADESADDDDDDDDADADDTSDDEDE